MNLLMKTEADVEDESGREDEKLRRRQRLRQRQAEEDERGPRKNRLAPFSKRERQFDWRIAAGVTEVEDEDGSDGDDD